MEEKKYSDNKLIVSFAVAVVIEGLVTNLFGDTKNLNIGNQF